MAALTTIAAGVGIAATATTTGMSFAQANKQRKLQTQAQSEARQAMEEARKKLEVNTYDQLNVPMEAYEREREALLSSGAQAIQAGVEGQSRGAAATVGRVQAGMNEAQSAVRTDMAKELSDLQKLSAEEDSRLRDIGVQLDLGEVEGAQLAARDAQQARTAAMQQGMQGITSLAQTGMELAPLYGQDLNAQKSATYAAIGKDDPAMIKLRQQEYNGQQVGLIDFNKMSNSEFRDFKKWLGPEQRQTLFQNQNYLQNYNPFQPF
jgi:hypothetical protein